MRVLLVDDHEIVRAGLRLVLTGAGIKTGPQTHGSIGCELIAGVRQGQIGRA